MQFLRGLAVGLALAGVAFVTARHRYAARTETGDGVPIRSQASTQTAPAPTSSAAVAGAALSVPPPASPPQRQVQPAIGREEARAYLRQTLDSIESRGRVMSSSDSEIDLLARVGASNIDLLLEAAADAHGADYYLVEAIGRLAGPEQQEAILAALARVPNLARVVRDRNWVQDARDTLEAGVVNREQFVSQEWVESVAALKDKSTYDALKRRLVESHGRRGTFDAIKDLPKIGITPQLIAEAWAQAKTDAPAAGPPASEILETTWETATFAPIAAEFGNRDALDRLVASLETPVGRGETRADFAGPPRGDPWIRRQTREVLLRITPAKGDDAQMRRWFEKHGRELVYDERKRRYIQETGRN